MEFVKMLPETNFTTTSNLTTTIPNTGGGGCPPVGIQTPVIQPTFYTIDVILGLLGNVVALWIFCFKLKTWNPNHLFLFNLVIADFMLLLNLPLRIDSLLRGHWVFGDGLCRIGLFLIFSNRTASTALMTVVAIYRYFKVVHPHHRFNYMTKRQAAFVLVLVWLLVISPRVPMLAFNHIKGSGNNTQCFFFTPHKETARVIIILVAMHRMLTVLEFIFPLAILLFCSIRISSFLRARHMRKPDKVRKAMRVCAAIVAVFTVCFLPSTVTTIGVWVIRTYRPLDCAAFYTIVKLSHVSYGLNFLNSALDPFVYVFSSSMFRKALLGALPCAMRCGQNAGENTSPSTTQEELNSMRANGDSITVA